MTMLYEVMVKGGRRASVPLTYEEWRVIFRTGKLNDPRGAVQHPLVWIQPVGFPDKRVLFEENLEGETLDGPAVS